MLASGRCQAREAADQILAAGWTYGVTPGMDDDAERYGEQGDHSDDEYDEFLSHEGEGDE